MTIKNDALTHLTGENILFIEQLYADYVEDPSSVDPSWIPVFEEHFGGVEHAELAGVSPQIKPRSIFAPPIMPANGATNGHYSNGVGLHEDSTFEDQIDGTQIHTPGKTSGFAASVEGLVRAYRLHGHVIADIDPLGMRDLNTPASLDPERYGLNESDMSAPARYEDLFNGTEVTVGKIVERLRDLYCGPIGIEYQYISDSESRQWLRHRIERENYAPIDGADEKKRIFDGLLSAEGFEAFLKKKYQNTKRFSLSGGDSLIPMLHALLDEAGRLGVIEVLFGMAHRGRLNVLHNIMGKEAEQMFSEFEASPNPEKYLGSSDVKYHMGYSSDYATTHGHSVHLSMAFNPSHLEFVNPVVVGRARAKQARLIEKQGLSIPDARARVMPLLLHGDAAFAGQGIVPESLNLSGLDGYSVGGAFHIVINNQVGFTTNPSDSRSTMYATDIAKMLEIPIFHVNGDDPEACVRAAKLAMQYRQKFNQDVVIDLVCYRYYGHNEGDDPRLTQPEMYQIIDKHPPVREHYSRRLIKEGVFTEDEYKASWKKSVDNYEPAFQEVKGSPREKSISSLSGLWNSYSGGATRGVEMPETGVALETLQDLGRTISTVPESFTPHRTIKRAVIAARASMAAGEAPLDWGMGEHLAFASLLHECTSIRISGQDAIRGTFSHRHVAMFDNKTGEQFWPTREITEGPVFIDVVNSSLSEAGVLGFEYGYSLDSPDRLVIWEAQFGDFVNGAQVIIDQFINSGEDKWDRMSGLVMLLPHGYEGQGPEHSSARLERFLQLCAEDNMFVCAPTTPAQQFHLLRRQIHMKQRKPLIVMTPKSLLRLAAARSPLADLTTGKFQEVIPEHRDLDADAVERVLVCSGKIYYDLLARALPQDAKKLADGEELREERRDVAIVRVEQLYPLDMDTLEQHTVDAYPNAEIVWVQEEPKNMGPWGHLVPMFFEEFPKRVRYIGRPESASPATGDPGAHRIEQTMIVEQSFE